MSVSNHSLSNIKLWFKKSTPSFIIHKYTKGILIVSQLFKRSFQQILMKMSQEFVKIIHCKWDEYVTCKLGGGCWPSPPSFIHRLLSPGPISPTNPSIMSRSASWLSLVKWNTVTIYLHPYKLLSNKLMLKTLHKRKYNHGLFVKWPWQW